MDFKGQIKELARELTKKVKEKKEDIKTEEATKHALIIPFIQILGYDISNPTEVIPEFVSDIGVKKGDKVDYAIIINGKPFMLIECKNLIEELESHNKQLFHYFAAVGAKIAILTNGIRYQFFSDIEQPNIMDKKPFLDFKINEMTDHNIDELKKFHKSYLDIANIPDTASRLKYSNEIKITLRDAFKEPADDLVKFFVRRTYPGNATKQIIDDFREIVKTSMNQLFNEKINERLNPPEIPASPPDEPTPDDNVDNEPIREIETTMDELEGYAIVKTILRSKGVDVNRISYKDTLNYFLICLDQHSWKPVCRLWLNTKKWYISLFDVEKKESRNRLQSLDDIYKYEDDLFKTVQNYD
jgi:hypothetical protein